MNDATINFKSKKWGLFLHYLAGNAGDGDAQGVVLSSDQWNLRIDQFDAVKFAAQIKEMGASYVVFTLGQNTGHYCAPNPVYDEITGIVPSKCSRRNLINDIADELEKFGIDLLVYLPSHPPYSDIAAKTAFGWDKELIKSIPVKEKEQFRNKEYYRKWEKTVAYWSESFGKKVKGFWIDGCGSSNVEYDFPDEPNFYSFAAAYRAGNPDSLLAMNNGVIKPAPVRVSPCEDYTAGETDHSLYLSHWQPNGKGGWVFKPAENEIDGLLLHLLVFIGQFWGVGSPRMGGDLVRAYTRFINDLGGIVSWDVPILTDGTIPQEFRDIVKCINK